MPRIPPRLFWQATRHSPHAAALLLGCKSLPLALNELRWIRQYIDQNTAPADRERKVRELCRKRSYGMPLQYLLKSQPFGPLEIACKPGVLIPRPETEAYTYHLAHQIELLRRGKEQQGLKILDLCTGTGCIPLLLLALLQHSFKSLQVEGVDISRTAVSLARQNLANNQRLGHLNFDCRQSSFSFTHGDIFRDQAMQHILSAKWDIVTSNPPYISKDVWDNGRGQIGYSVRKFEPALALVPGPHLEPPPLGWQSSDVFYARLLDMAQQIRPRLLLLEIGDEAQALRVAGNYLHHEMARHTSIEIWRDAPDIESDTYANTVRLVSRGQDRVVTVKGSGNIRSLLICNDY